MTNDDERTTVTRKYKKKLYWRTDKKRIRIAIIQYIEWKKHMFTKIKYHKVNLNHLVFLFDGKKSSMSPMTPCTLAILFFKTLETNEKLYKAWVADEWYGLGHKTNKHNIYM